MVGSQCSTSLPTVCKELHYMQMLSFALRKLWCTQLRPIKTIPLLTEIHNFLLLKKCALEIQTISWKLLTIHQPTLALASSSWKQRGHPLRLSPRLNSHGLRDQTCLAKKQAWEYLSKHKKNMFSAIYRSTIHLYFSTVLFMMNDLDFGSLPAQAFLSVGQGVDWL